MRILLLTLLTASTAFAITARDLVLDAEALYRDLPANDPEKPAVSLRLADLLFDAALELHGDVKSGVKEIKRADDYRARSLALYQGSLPRAKGANALRIKFQISRLQAYAGRFEAAMVLWRELTKQTQDPLIRRESALHLAEQLELRDNQTSLREALSLYKMTLPMTEKQSLRSYIHYRTAWTYFRMGQTGEAVSRLRESLSLAAKEEHRDLTRDLVLFMSREPSEPAKQVKILTEYQKDLKIPGLVDDLGEAYATADRREEYAFVLKHLNRGGRSLEREIALLNLNHDRMTPADSEKEVKTWKNLKPDFRDAASEKRSRETLLQLTTYWDGQRRAGKPGFDSAFTAGVDAFVAFFPKSDETRKTVAGWMAAFPAPEAQIAKLDSWLSSVKEPELELALRRRKLELARQTKQWPVVVAESEKIEKLNTADQRPTRYQRAKALYEMGKKDEALPLFVRLAAETGDKDQEITKFSQDLALDILNEKKNYGEIQAQVALWKMPGARGEELHNISEQARFEDAVAQNNAASLKTFTEFCMGRRFLPKSCDNAKTLAANQRDQTALIGILKAGGDETELARQLEVGARFGESARILEKKTASNDHLGLLKVALFFELEGESKERDRVLSKVEKLVAARKEKLPPAEQELVVQTLVETGRTGTAAGKIILDYCGNGGSGWRKSQLQDLAAIDKRQSGIVFVGKASRANFEKRVSLLKNLGERAECASAGLDQPDRELASRAVAVAYGEFADQIRATPVPAGLDEATLTEVKAQIEAMAVPFRDSAAAWQAKAGAFAQTSRAEVEAALKKRITQSAEENLKAANFDWRPMLLEARREPFNKAHFEAWMNHLESKGSNRLAGYLRGRVRGLEVQ